MKKILFISHDASRSGAPFVLLFFMRWLKQNAGNIQMDILLIEGGPLEEEFKKLCGKTLILSGEDEMMSSKKGIFQPGIKFLRKKAKTRDDMIFENS